MLRALFAFSRSREIAEDAVAEAFSQAIRRDEQIAEVTAWVWRAAFRIASRDLARMRRSMGALPETSYEMDADAAEVFRVLGRLSPRQRAAILLHHYVGYSVKEVAQIIGSTPPAVKVHLSVGRRRLRDLMEEENG